MIAAFAMALVPRADAGNSLAAAVVEAIPSDYPPSIGEDPTLFLGNLFIMTAGFFLGAMFVGRQGSLIWRQRRYDHPLHPVSLYRAITLLAGLGFTMRCGAEALTLWGWNPADPRTWARAMMAKRYLDPIAANFGWIWMMIAMLAEPGIEHQLRKTPLPVDMWSRWPVLARAGIVVVLCFSASLVAVLFR